VVQLDDTWIWQNNDWHELTPASSPGRRKLAGAAFDSARDRVVLYGGHRLSDDRKRLENLRDTWEFDGTTWTRVAENGPELSKPILEYDPIRNETIMLGFTSAGATQMYRFNAQTHVWTRIEHSTIPLCVNEATLNWNPDRQRIIFTGGFCAGMIPGAPAEVLEWNGESWAAQNSLTAPSRVFGHAAAYDQIRDNLVTFAGTTSSGTSNVSTYVLERGSNWRFIFDAQTPAPRSLAAADTDPDSGAIWLYSGVVDPGSGSTDLWRYANGDWQQVIIEGTPDTCSNALAAYDTDRKRFVVTCSSGFVFELDTVALKWTRLDTLKEVPPGRSFASLAYDPTIKRTVLYGGFNGVNYLNDTWLWDGTKWTEVERNPAPGRSLAAMWYDPTIKKVVIYGGIGRPDNESRITRYSDMYSLDSNQGWTKLTPASTPGARYGAQVTVDPRTNKALLFGGILYQEDAGGANGRQSYANDMWEWNGTAWTQRALTVAPPARENGVFEYDPSTRRLVMFGGYAGTF
ncbi:MAG TPA: kelch repeat-containing protein, partial [Thermoanaerobaculia bacterium]